MASNLPINASLNKAIESVKNNIFSNLYCHNIGRILEYDAITCTATVEMLQVKQWYGQSFYPTLITDVPIVMFGTANCRITMPNPVGNYCVLLFMDRNIDNFMETGEAQLPATERMHSMSDCVALLTINSNINEAPMYDENALTLSNEQNFIKIKPDSISIANDKQNLASLIQEFLTACENIVCGSYPLTSSSKKAFTDLKTKFEELLK